MYFKLRTEAYTSTLGLLLTYSLIDSLSDTLDDSLICPHNALRNLAKVEKAYSTLTRFQAESQLAGQQSENSPPEKNIWLTTTTSQKPSSFLQCSLCDSGENLLQDEKKICTRSLAEAKLQIFAQDL